MHQSNSEVKDVKKFLVLYKVDVEEVNDKKQGRIFIEKETPLALITDPAEEAELRLHEKELSRNGYRLKRDWFESLEIARELLGLAKDLIDAVKTVLAKIKAKRKERKAKKAQD